MFLVCCFKQDLYSSFLLIKNMKSNEPVLKDDYCSLDDVIVQDKTIYDKTVNFNPVETTLYQQSKDYISNNLDAFLILDSSCST